MTTEERIERLESRARRSRWVAVVMMAGCASLIAMGQAPAGAGDVAEMNKPYTPTRLQWLAVELNALLNPYNGLANVNTSGYSITFVPVKEKPELLIWIQTSPGVNHANMKVSVESSRRIATSMIERYGWSKWVTVREHFQDK